MGIWYATREDVKSALDYKETARADATVDLAIEAASRKVEDMTHRTFYPSLGIKYADWPNYQRAYSWRLWAQGYDILAVTSLVSGGVEIPSGNYFLEPVNQGPPYNRIEIDISTDSSFNSTTTPQRQVAISGTFGYCNATTSAGSLSSAIVTADATRINVTDSAAIGVGDLIKVDDEYMTVVGKEWLATGDGSPDLAANKAATLLTLLDGSYAFGEVLQIDAERMIVVGQAGTTVTVQRATDGTVLGAHVADASDVYAPRTLVVERGQCGTTAATHGQSAAVVKNVAPGPVVELVTAYALDALQQKQSAYSRTVGSGDNARNATGAGLAALENLVDKRYTRRRFGAV